MGTFDSLWTAIERAQPASLPRLEPVGTPRQQLTAGRAQQDWLAGPDNLQFDNGLGGFTPDGMEYVIYLRPGETRPTPWINVIANPDFGLIASESGVGASWAANSGENRLTSWRNDPVTDTPSTIIYVWDEETAEVWSPTPQPAPGQAPYLIRYGAGYTIYEHHSHALQQHLCVSLVPDAPVQIMRLRLQNSAQSPRRITVTCYAEFVLGEVYFVLGQGTNWAEAVALVEHFRQLGHDDIARSLDITLHEEGDTDKELSRIARGTFFETGINEVALN